MRPVPFPGQDKRKISFLIWKRGQNFMLYSSTGRRFRIIIVRSKSFSHKSSTFRLLLQQQPSKKFYWKYHSLEKRGLCLMKSSSEMLQNLSYYMHSKTPKLLFPFFISCYLIFFTNECPGLCWHRSGHSLGKTIK